jgi:hypothetical protein
MGVVVDTGSPLAGRGLLPRTEVGMTATMAADAKAEAEAQAAAAEVVVTEEDHMGVNAIRNHHREAEWDCLAGHDRKDFEFGVCFRGRLTSMCIRNVFLSLRLAISSTLPSMRTLLLLLLLLLSSR